MSTTAMIATDVPDLNQTKVEQMACPTFYAAGVIRGHETPGGLQSARGVEIHEVMSLYVSWCGSRGIAADWGKFDQLALGAGAEAAGILEGLRDSYSVDHEHLYGTELVLASDTGRARGKLDVLYLPTHQHALIHDFKSHPRPFDPDKTDQCLRYAFLVFENFPDVEEVTFELIFARYAKCRRSVTFTRAADYARLRQHILNTRSRQEGIHERYAQGEVLPAYPGKHCAYCPLLQIAGRGPMACPISQFNPHANASLVERARFAVWLRESQKVNNAVMKDAIDAMGHNITIDDYNGREMSVGYVARESVQFPLLKVLPFLLDYQHASPDDVTWLDKLLISSTKLKSYLKAKKRAFLHQAILDSAAVAVTKPTFKLGYVAPAEQQVDEDHEDYEEE